MPKWYEINARVSADGQPSEVIIPITQEIGYWGIDAKTFIDDLSAYKGLPVKLIINSPGGNVFDALTIVNYLRNVHGGQVTTHVIGMAASAASLILLAGDKRLIANSAFVMVHDIQSSAYGTPGEMQDVIDALNTIKGSLATMYSRVTGVDLATAEAWMSKDTWFDAGDALAANLVTEIIDGDPVTASFDFAQVESLVPPELRDKVKACLQVTATDPQPAATDPQPAATDPQPAATDPQPAAISTGVVASVTAECTKHGLTGDAIKAVLVSDKLPLSDTTARTAFIAFAVDVGEFCTAMGDSNSFAEMLKCDNLADVRSAFAAKLANTSTVIDATKPVKSTNGGSNAMVDAVARHNARQPS